MFSLPNPKFIYSLRRGAPINCLVLTELFKTELSLTGFIGNTLYSCDKCGTFIAYL